MRYTALDHVGFTVSSLDRSVPFYTRLLEAEPLLRKVWDVEYVGRIVGYPGVKMECAFWRLPGGGDPRAPRVPRAGAGSR